MTARARQGIKAHTPQMGDEMSGAGDEPAPAAVWARVRERYEHGIEAVTASPGKRGSPGRRWRRGRGARAGSCAARPRRQAPGHTGHAGPLQGAAAAAAHRIRGADRDALGGGQCRHERARHPGDEHTGAERWRRFLSSNARNAPGASPGASTTSASMTPSVRRLRRSLRDCSGNFIAERARSGCRHALNLREMKMLNRDWRMWGRLGKQLPPDDMRLAQLADPRRARCGQDPRRGRMGEGAGAGGLDAWRARMHGASPSSGRPSNRRAA